MSRKFPKDKKEYARYITRRALSSGKLKKPKYCEVCWVDPNEIKTQPWHTGTRHKNKMENYLEQLKASKPTVTITPTPLILEKVGESFRGLYIGMQSFNKTDVKTGEITSLPVAHFYDGIGIRFNMGAQLTRAIAMLKPGISVEITLTELKANAKGGKTKIYSVAPLDIPFVSVEEMFGGVLSISAPAPEHLLPAPSAPIDEAEYEIDPKTGQPYGSR